MSVCCPNVPVWLSSFAMTCIQYPVLNFTCLKDTYIIFSQQDTDTEKIKNNIEETPYILNPWNTGLPFELFKLGKEM